MRAPTTTEKILAIVAATLMFALSATLAFGAAYDYTTRSTVPAGVTVAGQPIGGLDIEQARAAIEDAVSAPLLRPVTVVADGGEYSFDPREAVAIDTDAMLADALTPRQTAPLLARLRSDMGVEPLTYEVAPAFVLDPQVVDAFVLEIANEVNSKPVDAKLAVNKKSMVEISPEQEGRKLDSSATAAAIAGAFATEKVLDEGDRRVAAVVSKVEPAVTKDSFGKTIVVDLSQRRIRLFDGDKVEKTYPCAIGTAQFPTPTGEWEITQLRYRPTWVNPGSDWATDMPPYIPPGPSNPLGTRAINLSAPGIRFHGTNNIGSVGTAASHGCMRMYRGDIEDLYERVSVGMKVYIVR